MVEIHCNLIVPKKSGNSLSRTPTPSEEHDFVEIHCSLPFSSGRLTYLLGRTMGCRLARAYASVTYGELPSVRMTLPIDMKNLFARTAVSVAVLSAEVRLRPRIS